MAKCASCAAPLPANSQVCRYCGVRNDVDLQGQFQLITSQSNRQCPECEIALQTIDLRLGDPFHIDRCAQCFGLFFDPGEIEILLTSAVSPVFGTNLAWLDNINKDRYSANKPFKYLKCPVCQNLMDRTSYGHRSGVVIDHCKLHGVWLESGEISHLLEWKKAGGQLLQKPKSQDSSRRQRLNHDAQAELDSLLQQHENAWESPKMIEAIGDLLLHWFN